MNLEHYFILLLCKYDVIYDVIYVYFQKDFPENGHDPKVVGKLYIFVNYMTLYPFIVVHFMFL